MTRKLYIRDAEEFGLDCGSIVQDEDGNTLHHLPMSLEDAAEATQEWYPEATVEIVRK